ncbi:alpha/beta fold hydrolase [Streptomyces mirabilis]|uniref:alpha/beta fold hydrolase n=1 Tax=Streptomyces mirabilis TaxID=68239 RepID=UPI003430F3BE
MTARYTVVVPDLRGPGDSARPADGYDSATMSDDIAALMAHLGHEFYSVLGEDWGAVIGYQVAVRRHLRDARRRRTEPAIGTEEAGHPGAGSRRHRSRLRRRPRSRR